MKQEQKIDKRSKEYKESLKKLPKGVGHTSYIIPKETVEAIQKEFDTRREKGISMAICMPEVGPAKQHTHQEQLDDLHQCGMKQDTLIQELQKNYEEQFARLTKLETIVG